MEKIIKSIIAMNDSINLNEKELTEKNLGQETGVSSTEGQKPAENDTTKITKIGKVTAIDQDDVLLKFDNDEEGAIPKGKLDVEAGCLVQVTIENKDGNQVITNAEIYKEEPKNENLVAKIKAYNFSTDLIDIEILGTGEQMFFKFNNLLPSAEFGKDVTVRTLLNVEIEEEKGIRRVKAAQIKSDENKETENEKPVTDTKILPTDVDMDYIDPNFLIDCMSVPTHSELEYRMVAYIVMWARRNNILYEFDEFGNIYLTKGELDDGEFYPCVTSHLDTVQYKHDPYIYAGVPLELEISNVINQGVTEHKVAVNNEGGSEIGIGADDKGGICICLSMFDHIDKLKACFFLDEERGCHGSKHLEEDWFKDVGYVIGFDSPDLYRAAWACDGTQLFDMDFYNKHMKKVCDSWGLVKGCFFSEPYTDVKEIREKTEIICMNFGNGGYNAHNMGGTEYCIMEHMDQACGMGIELIESIGNTRHTLKHRGRYDSVNPTNTAATNEILMLEQLGDNTRKGYKPTGSTSSNSSSSSSSSSNNNTKPTVSKDDEIKFETVKYITEKYDSLIDNIKEDVLETVKTICEANNIDFEMFEKSITDNFSSEIKF